MTEQQKDLQAAIQTAIEQAILVDNMTPEQVNEVMRYLLGHDTLTQNSCDECGKARPADRLKFDTIGKVWICDVCPD